MGNDPQRRWWQGSRGEWYVALQVVLMLLILFGPRTVAGLPDWTPPFPEGRWTAGAAFVMVGSAFFLWSLYRLGSALTSYPTSRTSSVECRLEQRPDGQRRRTGPLAPRLEPNQLGFLELESGGVLDDDHAVVREEHRGQRVVAAVPDRHFARHGLRPRPRGQGEGGSDSRSAWIPGAPQALRDSFRAGRSRPRLTSDTRSRAPGVSAWRRSVMQIQAANCAVRIRGTACNTDS